MNKIKYSGTMIEEIKHRIKESKTNEYLNSPNLVIFIKNHIILSIPHILLMSLILVIFGLLVVLFFSGFDMLICLYLVILLTSFCISALMEDFVVSIFSGLLFGVISGLLCYFVDYSYVHLHLIQVTEICILMSVIFCVLGFFLLPILIENIE